MSLFKKNAKSVLTKMGMYNSVENNPFSPENSNVEQGRPYANGPESSISFSDPATEYAEAMFDYDIISFDVMDTLLFRPFSCPTDIFLLLEKGNKIDDFRDIRIQAELTARENKYNSKKSTEVTLDEIYAELSKNVDTDIEKLKQSELDAELDLCFANPYMLAVFKNLQENGKKIIACCDDYFSKEFISKMLEKCGFTGFEDIFVSCELQVSKFDGSMYKMLKTKYGKDKKIIHIGDNEQSDYVKAKASKISSVYYKNVNEIGNPHRTNQMGELIGSAYRGIVNAHLHNGGFEFPLFYEFGFIGSGLSAVFNVTHQTKLFTVKSILRDLNVTDKQITQMAGGADAFFSKFINTFKNYPYIANYTPDDTEAPLILLYSSPEYIKQLRLEYKELVENS